MISDASRKKMAAPMELQGRRGSTHKLNGTLLFSDSTDKGSREGSPNLPETTKVPAAVRKISFPADSIINAVIQDGDVHELLRILGHQRSEVDLNQANHVGLTALHHAVLTNNIDSVKLLLTYGADVRVQDVYGFSPLHTSAALGFVQITSLLIVFGADVFSLTKQKELPIDVAKDISVIRLLTNEMCLRVHQELFLSAYLFMKCKRVWTFLYQFTSFLITTLFTLLIALKVKCVSYIEKQRAKSKLRKKTTLSSHNDAISRDIKCVSGDLKEFPETKDITVSIKKRK